MPVKAGEVTDLFENDEYDAAFRIGYADALNGDEESKFIIGKIYLDGLGSAKKNITKGLKLIKSAANDDYIKAAEFLGNNYYNGEYSDQNKRLALKYYKNAVQLIIII